MNIRYPLYEGVYRILTLIKGFKSKNGKVFDASLAFDGQFNVTFVFPEKKGKLKK